MKQHCYNYPQLSQIHQQQQHKPRLSILESCEKENSQMECFLSKPIGCLSLQKDSRNCHYSHKPASAGVKESLHKKFMSRQNEIKDCIDEMENNLIKLGEKIKSKPKYNNLYEKCWYNLCSLKELSIHNENKKHLNPYFQQLHSKSTQIKVHLLSMLKDQSNLKKQFQLKNKMLEAEIKKLHDEIGQMLKVRQQELNHKKQLEAKIKQLQQELQSIKTTQYKNKNGGNFDLLNDFNIPLGYRPNQKTNAQWSREQMQFSALDNQINPLKSKHMHASEIKKKKIAVSTQRANEDLYRFILIQAFTIEDEILAEQQNFV